MNHEKVEHTRFYRVIEVEGIIIAIIAIIIIIIIITMMKMLIIYNFFF